MKMEHRDACGTMRDLPGLKSAVVPCYAADSQAQLLKILRSGRVATTPYDSGSLTVWWGDDNVLHGQVWKDGRVTEDVERYTLKGMAEWVRAVWDRS